MKPLVSQVYYPRFNGLLWPAIRGDDPASNFIYRHPLFLKVVGQQCFIDADATVLTVLRFKATV